MGRTIEQVAAALAVSGIGGVPTEDGSPFEGDAGDDARAQDPDDRDGSGGVGAEEEEDGRDDDEDEAGSQSDQGGEFGEVEGEGSHVEVRQGYCVGACRCCSCCSS